MNRTKGPVKETAENGRGKSEPELGLDAQAKALAEAEAKTQEEVRHGKELLEAFDVDVEAFSKELRWGIVPTLVWVAGRDMNLTAHHSNPGKSFDRAEMALSVKRAMLESQG